LDKKLAETAQLCLACHGVNGLPEDEEVPVIWGQHFYYLYVQLKDFKAGRRKNEVMEGVVKDLSRDDLKALAQHFSEEKFPATGYRSSDAIAALGELATGAGQCVQCHLGGYEGDSRVPRLKGQTVAYLKNTMLEFKKRIRMNSPAKSSLFASYSDEDIARMAEFLAGF
jgi:cytochrome c553